MPTSPTGRFLRLATCRDLAATSFFLLPHNSILSPFVHHNQPQHLRVASHRSRFHAALQQLLWLYFGASWSIPLRCFFPVVFKVRVTVGPFPREIAIYHARHIDLVVIPCYCRCPCFLFFRFSLRVLVQDQIIMVTRPASLADVLVRRPVIRC